MTFRVETEARGAFTEFILSGRIDTPAIAELRRLFELQADHLILDLKDVGVIDRDETGQLRPMASSEFFDLVAMAGPVFRVLLEPPMMSPAVLTKSFFQEGQYCRTYAECAERQNFIHVRWLLGS